MQHDRSCKDPRDRVHDSDQGGRGLSCDPPGLERGLSKGLSNAGVLKRRQRAPVPFTLQTFESPPAEPHAAHAHPPPTWPTGQTGNFGVVFCRVWRSCVDSPRASGSLTTMSQRSQ